MIEFIAEFECDIIIRLLSLPERAKELLTKGKLTIGQLRPLIGQKNVDIYLEMIVKNKLSSRQVERLIKSGISKKSESKIKNVDIENLEKELTETTGLIVYINFDNKKQKGNLKIECKDLKEFNYIIDKIKS